MFTILTHMVAMCVIDQNFKFSMEILSFKILCGRLGTIHLERTVSNNIPNILL